MIRFLTTVVLSFALTLPLRAQEGHTHWNPDGANLYRLIRVYSYETAEEYHRAIDDALSWLKTSGSPTADADARTLYSLLDVLVDGYDDIRLIYDQFIRAMAERHLTKTDGTSKVNLLMEGKGAGMEHLKVMEGYLQYCRKQQFSPTNIADHADYFDDYLVSLGVEGFAKYIERAKPWDLDFHSQWFPNLRRNLRTAKSGITVGLACATLIAGIGIGRMWGNDPPAERAPQVIPAKMQEGRRKSDPQVEADNAAQLRGQQAAERFNQAP